MKRPVRNLKRTSTAQPHADREGAEPSEQCRELAEKFPSRLGEWSKTIYPLPRELIDRINAEQPGFFSEDDLRFERALAATGASVFFLGNGLRHPLLLADAAQSNEPSHVDARQRKHERTINQMLIQEMRKSLSDDEIKEAFAADAHLAAQTAELQTAFLGWLVTDPGFRFSRDRFRQLHEHEIFAMERFPTAPKTVFGEKPRRPPTADAVALQIDFQNFFVPFGIETLLTWELPILLEPELLATTANYLPALSRAGVNVFVPFYALRTNTLDLRSLILQRFARDGTAHLQPWLEKETRDFGLTRWSRMFKIYVYVELALRTRYRLRGTAEALNLAIGQYLSGSRDGDVDLSSDDTIRKIRQEMNRRLKDSRAPVSPQRRPRKAR